MQFQLFLIHKYCKFFHIYKYIMKEGLGILPQHPSGGVVYSSRFANAITMKILI